MPSLLPPRVPYQPIVTPPGGLLASAVGTPQAPAPPIDPNKAMSTGTMPGNPAYMVNGTPAPPPLANPNYAMENDSVVGQLNAITDSGSQYIQQAEAAGTRTAQRRGLLNSSIAAGASRGAAISAAAPLAMQEAQQRAQRNLTRLDAGFQSDRLATSIASNERMQGVDIASREAMQTEALAAESERLGRTLTAQEQAQLREITNSQFMQGRDLENRTQLTTMELESRRTLQDQAIAAESERLGRQLSAAEAENLRNITSQQFMQTRDIGSREGMLTTELDNRLQIAREDAAATLQRLGLTNEAENMRANLSAATQVQIATLNNLSQQQQQALSYYASMSGNYLQAIASVWNNPDIPAPARQAAIDQFASVLTSGINMPAALYGTNLNWGTTGTTPGTTGTTPAPGLNTTVPVQTTYPGPTPAQINGLLGNHIDGDYDAAVEDYNRWALQNGQPPMTNRSSAGSTSSGGSGYFQDGMGQYSGIGLIGGLFG